MNWGYKLIAAGGLFITFILTMSLYMLYKKDRDTLVDEDYYQAGMQFGQKLEAQQNMVRDHMQPEVKVSKNLLLVRLRSAAHYELTLLCPADKRQDKRFSGKTTGNHLIVIDRAATGAGHRQLELTWQSAGKMYNYSKKLFL
ncbi:hypothetical protein C7T94_08935 [Pedobacter yulinensis]|uniref:Nitrogen fixation protein FixH n=1 Tax=Pedobacter yulinensis TaxID=2126353 RepID=A0A2T3HK29_9SPHI|nr:FixH family protein [Pedobacter yulinensis]PST82763.1 hypothetical protein C7T94_08935 [Pedobacter yulinensis]